MAEIVLDNVTKRYADGTEAVKDVDLDIADGEFMILVGPVGLREVDRAADDRRARGHHRRRAADRRRGRQRQGAEGPRHRDGVPELRAVPAHDRAREHGLRAEDAPRVDKARSTSKVDEAARDPRARPSTSTASRPTCPAASASAWRWAARSCASPSAFLMDEPLSNLDAKLRVQMRTEVSRIQQRLGTTTVYVTHDQTEAMTLGDRVAVHARGRAPAGRLAQGALQQPAQPVRRRVHRLAGDELLRRRRSRAARSQPADRRRRRCPTSCAVRSSARRRRAR